VLTLSNKGLEIAFKSSVQIQIQFPTTSIVRGIYWSRYSKDSLKGIITSFKNVTYSTDADISTDTMNDFSLASYSGGIDPGNSNLSMVLFDRPFLAKQISLGNITYTADPLNNQTIPLYNTTHTIQFQLEIFGCDSVDLSKGKSNPLFFNL